jgi:hypothetical protein
MGNGRNFSLGNEFHWSPLLYHTKEVERSRYAESVSGGCER